MYRRRSYRELALAPTREEREAQRLAAAAPDVARSWGRNVGSTLGTLPSVALLPTPLAPIAPIVGAIGGLVGGTIGEAGGGVVGDALADPALDLLERRRRQRDAILSRQAAREAALQAYLGY